MDYWSSKSAYTEWARGLTSGMNLEGAATIKRQLQTDLTSNMHIVLNAYCTQRPTEKFVNTVATFYEAVGKGH